ncbi:hypothetical protein CPB85DRAFT_528627 [Mucidula mucida]|nr:hypothetical protein CPB85DRAFT_528627 [Mucidula mucida]
MTTEGVFADDFEDSTPALRLAVRNAMRATFHIARLDFGIVRGNQIYQSSAFFDENMEDYSKTWPSDLIENIFWAALCSPCDVWPTVPSAARTVVLSYLRPVFQLKPIGSAIVSVFVATFAMVSALWKVFTFVAGCFTDSRPDETAEKVDPIESADLEKQIPLHDEGDGNSEGLSMIETRK